MAAPFAAIVPSPSRISWMASLLVETRVRSGLRASSRARVASLNSAHSRYSRLSAMLRIGMSMNGQATLTNVTMRQPSWVASRSSAGNQWAACESPTSATVYVEPLSP